MRNRSLTIWMVVVVFAVSAKGEIVDVLYSDHHLHTIDQLMNDTRVFCEGDFTTVDVVEGGSLFELYIMDNARGLISGGTILTNLIAYSGYVSISEGAILYELKAYGSSQVEMSGGALGDDDFFSPGGEIYAYDNSQVVVSGGSIKHLLEINGHSQGFVSDGIIWGIAAARESGHLTVSGGAIQELVAFENGQVTVYGMSSEPVPYNVLIADNEGTITIHGSEFYVDSQQVSSGEIISLLNGDWRDDPERSLAVKFDNGDFFAASFYIGHNASIVLVLGPTAPPVADAGGPYSIYVGDTLTLDASGSTDADDDITSYMWDLDDDGTFETDAGNQAVFDVNYAYLESLGLGADNTYTILLQVTDGEEQSDVAESTLSILPPPVIEVAFDIKPGSCPNPMVVKGRGVLTVAIVGSESFDVYDIDVSTLLLEGVAPIRSGYEDVATPVDGDECECTTEAGDGVDDLTLKFNRADIVPGLGTVHHGDVVVLTLTGELLDGTSIEGADCVVIVGKADPAQRPPKK